MTLTREAIVDGLVDLLGADQIDTPACELTITADDVFPYPGP